MGPSLAGRGRLYNRRVPRPVLRRDLPSSHRAEWSAAVVGRGVGGMSRLAPLFLADGFCAEATTVHELIS